MHACRGARVSVQVPGPEFTHNTRARSMKRARLETPALSVVLPVYNAVRTVDYPRYEDGTLSAAVHPACKDFVPVRKGDPIFLTMGADAPLGFETTEAEEAKAEEAKAEDEVRGSPDPSRGASRNGPRRRNIEGRRAGVERVSL